MEVTLSLGADLLVGNCEVHLLNHYVKMGFRAYGGIYNHPQNGVLVPIALITGDIDHVRKLKSPLLPVFEAAGMTIDEEKVNRLRMLIADEAAVRSKLESSTMTYMHQISDILENKEGLSEIIPDLQPEEARTLLKMSLIMNCNAGDGIIVQGHVSRTVYILLSGSLDVRHDNRLIAQIDRRGEVVGEVAFFTDSARMSDVYAGPNGARLLALNDRVLRDMTKTHGPVAAKFLYYITQSVCNKLRQKVT